MKTFLPLYASGVINDLRYHPTPPGNAPPPVPAGFFSSNVPSILQSCGRFNSRQLVSTKVGSIAVESAVNENRQPLSNESIFRLGFSLHATSMYATSVRQIEISFADFMMKVSGALK